jgi:uncharacterized protein (TIGR03435 family)
MRIAFLFRFGFIAFLVASSVAAQQPQAPIDPSTILKSQQNQAAQRQAVGATATKFEYEVASFTLDKSGVSSGRNSVNAESYYGSNVTMQALILRAYGIRANQLAGAPPWLNTEKYDVAAKTDGDVADAFQKLSPEDREIARQHMFQVLLADRLKLTIHRETKDLPVYMLVIAKNGPKLKEAAPGETSTNGRKSGGDGFTGAGVKGKNRGAERTMNAQALSISSLVATLTGSVGLPVVDKTGLTGKYDFSLHWMAETLSAGDNVGPPIPLLTDSSAPSIFTALQQQLGLKLVSGKGPVEFMVIDHVERPSGN